jgi:hypothetical protein
MITGTPIHNTFADLIGQTMLLPGGGFFTSTDHFSHLFCDKPALEPEVATWKGQLCRRLFQGLIVARPKQFVKLPPKQEIDYPYNSTKRMWNLRVISRVWEARYFQRQKQQTQYPVKQIELFLKAMGQITEAERLASALFS